MFRPCDLGARRWLGPLKSSVFAPPIEAELHKWRLRWRAGEKQDQGHSRGLLPAIHSADELRSANSNTLESHPELVFAAISGRPLSTAGSKTLLLGLLARAYLLQRQGIVLDLYNLIWRDRISTDNFLDAIAMALVALSWNRLGDDLQVIRGNEGVPERLGDADSWAFLMALPEVGPRTLKELPLTADELIVLASKFQPVRAPSRSDANSGTP